MLCDPKASKSTRWVQICLITKYLGSKRSHCAAIGSRLYATVYSLYSFSWLTSPYARIYYFWSCDPPLSWKKSITANVLFRLSFSSLMSPFREWCLKQAACLALSKKKTGSSDTISPLLGILFNQGSPLQFTGMRLCMHACIFVCRLNVFCYRQLLMTLPSIENSVYLNTVFYSSASSVFHLL